MARLACLLCLSVLLGTHLLCKRLNLKKIRSLVAKADAHDKAAEKEKAAEAQFQASVAKVAKYADSVQHVEAAKGWQDATGVYLRRGAESDALRANSNALHNHIQSSADTLGPGDTLDFLRALRLCAPCKYQRFGEDNDGGYVMCADGLDKGLVGAYSFGINGFDGWGMAIASRFNIPLNEYDCTSLKQPVACKGCQRHFHPQCVLHNDGDAEEAAESLRGISDQRASDNEGNADDASKMTGASFKTFTQIFKESGNANAKDRSLLLKMDVESAEWKVFAEEPVENLKKFREIVVEYHSINNAANHQLYAKAVKKVEQAGFSVAHMHGNNWGRGMGKFGEFSIPDVIEVTYIQTPAKGCAANIPYHNKLDMPNNGKRPEMDDAVLPTK